MKWEAILTNYGIPILYILALILSDLLNFTTDAKIDLGRLVYNYYYYVLIFSYVMMLKCWSMITHTHKKNRN